MSGPADNTSRCPVCSMMPHVHGCTPEKCGAPTTVEPTAASPGPWRVRRIDIDGGPRDGQRVWIVLDVNGKCVAECELAVDAAFIAEHGPPALFVRAVTERSGAMEALLRDVAETSCRCDTRTCIVCRAEVLLAEIDAAKAPAASSPALISRCVLDQHTCPTCFAADGSPATSTPACEHIAKGTGTCRCVLVPNPAKAGG